MPARFYLGTHMVNFLPQSSVPWFVARRRLSLYKTAPRAAGAWVLDSGGYSELTHNGAWSITTKQYINEIIRWSDEVGRPDWVAPMDYMCEASVLKKTKLGVHEHQRRTIVSYLRIREEVGDLVAPVLQGWTLDDYLRCIDMYADLADVDLTQARIVGVGSVCRRNSTPEIVKILTAIADEDINIHAFGVKGKALSVVFPLVKSADSMAWSSDARLTPIRLPGHTHINCANCFEYAMAWRRNLLSKVRGR